MSFFDVVKNESCSSNESIKTFNGNVEFFPRFKKRVRRSSNRFDVLRVKRRIFRRFDSFVVFRVDDSKKNVLPGLEYFETIITNR